MPFETIALLAPVILIAYAVFGMTGFGSAVIAVPILVQVIPLQMAVPLVVLLDLACTAIVGGRNWKQVSTTELRRLFPWMMLGIIAGTTVLGSVSAKWPLIALGLFVLFISVRNLAASPARPAVALGSGWVLPFGFGGGIFSALFGTGGPIYTVYLSSRLPDTAQFRATISVIILLSGVTRAATFGAAGLYADPALLQAAGVLLPISLIGVFAGSRLRHRVPPGVIRRAVFVLLLVAGVGALLRGLLTPT